MHKISELMDGELRSGECKRQIARLKSDAQLSASWDTYHLIRDALRQEVDLVPQFTRRVHQCLQREPTVIAPHTRLSHRVVRYALPMAAGVAGVAVVAWLALSAQAPAGPGQIRAAASNPEQSATLAQPALAGSAMSDYLVAHQEFSPRTAMQGVASYVRTGSAEQADPAR